MQIGRTQGTAPAVIYVILSTAKELLFGLRFFALLRMTDEPARVRNLPGNDGSLPVLELTLFFPIKFLREKQSHNTILVNHRKNVSVGDFL